jgi:hypothetical protein
VVDLVVLGVNGAPELLQLLIVPVDRAGGDIARRRVDGIVVAVLGIPLGQQLLGLQVFVSNAHGLDLNHASFDCVLKCAKGLLFSNLLGIVILSDR